MPTLVRRPRVVSDGTPKGTWVEDAQGNRVDLPLSAISWTIDMRSPRRRGQALLTVELARIDARGELAEVLRQQLQPIVEGSIAE